MSLREKNGGRALRNCLGGRDSKNVRFESILGASLLSKHELESNRLTP
jgi:hypothetical protein